MPNKVLFILVLALAVNSCSFSKSSPTSPDPPCLVGSAGCIRIYYLNPTSAWVGATVFIVGSGFTDKDNTVHFGNGVIPNLSSGRNNVFTVLPFVVPTSIDPACRYSTPPCLIPTVLTTPGDYDVSFSNINGQSASLKFTVTAR